MVDANQAWSVNEAIEWMKSLAHLKPMWIEEPTSPDDVLGHATISKALRFKTRNINSLMISYYAIIKLKVL